MTFPTQMTTARLQLRPVNQADTDYLFTLWSDPLVTRYMNIEPFKERSQASAMIAFFEQTIMLGNAARYVIVEQEQVIGTCGFNTIDTANARTEIGYELATSQWGKGYGTEVVAALTQCAFSELKLIRVEAKVHAQNVASAQILLKNHYQHEGRLRKYERYGDQLEDTDIFSCIYGIDVAKKE